MSGSSLVISVGIRDSRLSRLQSEQALARLGELLPALAFTLVPMSSPGDRDRAADLRDAPADFFTRDLDDAVLDGALDCALHSAKDLPDELRDGLDMFCLPWREDRRDALVYPQGVDTPPPNPRVGVSSGRRRDYALRRFPDGAALPVRGNIDDRVRQLDEGKFDILIMAVAGLSRLGLEGRIAERVPLDELPTPPGQGSLALTFKKGSPRFNAIRQLFVKPVIIAGAGVGSAAHATLGVVEALRHCDVCLHDALCPASLLEFLPKTAEAVPVGKRAGKHSRPQEEISALMVDYARKGHAVVRLKGGDPGIFGRLGEELDALADHHLPFITLPGVSSMNAAAARLGVSLTRRGMARGFTASAPRQAGDGRIAWFSNEERRSFTQIFYMAVDGLAEVVEKLLAEGYPPDLPVAVALDAAAPEERVVSGPLAEIAAKMPKTASPGIVLVGEAASQRLLCRSRGALGGAPTLFAGSETIANEAVAAIERWGGHPIRMPMIRLAPTKEAATCLPAIAAADWLLVSSLSCAAILLDIIKTSGFDLRRLPKLAVSGTSTRDIFARNGVYAEACPDSDYGTEGMLRALADKTDKTDKLVWLRSDAANPATLDRLKALVPSSEGIVFYHNIPLQYSSLPDFEAVLFTSPSSAKTFVDNFSMAALDGKTVCVIGAPTEIAVKALGAKAEILKPSEASLNGMLAALAARKVNTSLQQMENT